MSLATSLSILELEDAILTLLWMALVAGVVRARYLCSLKSLLFHYTVALRKVASIRLCGHRIRSTRIATPRAVG